MKYRELERFRTVRGETLKLAEGLSQQQLDFKPKPEIWSVGEVLDHLHRFDELFGSEIKELLRLKGQGKRPFIRRSLSDYGLSLPCFPDALLPFLEPPLLAVNLFVPESVRGAMFRSRAVPAKSPPLTAPEQGRAGEALRRELQDFPDSVDRMAEATGGADLRELKFYQPLTGFTNAAGVLETLANHELRHQAQIRDVLAAPGFPAA